jgi:dipeptidyl-peptidase 4
MRYTTNSTWPSAIVNFAIAILATFMPGPPVSAEPLTIARIFADPDLSGPRLREPKFSPDGRYVTYLQGKADNKDQLDLWAFDTRNGSARMLVDSRQLVSEEKLSAEEEARRERQRTASLRGIVEYEFSSDGRRLLIPLGGDLYLYELGAKANPVTRLTNTDAYETDAKLSPAGRYVSFIRDQNLFVIDLRTRKEQALTTDGAGLVQNGVAEFVAQEEMDRSTGYWWSPDDSHIAYTRIDDTPVQEVERFEINADGARMFRQRYPAAGTANTKVELKVMALASAKVTDIPLGLNDGYLARVKWFPDAKSLAIQRQTRDQKRRVADGNQSALDRAERRFQVSRFALRLHLVLPSQRVQTSVSVRSRRQAGAPADRRRMDGGRRRHGEWPGRRR